MVGHERPGNTPNSPPGEIGADSFAKDQPVPIIDENVSFLIPPPVDMVNRTWEIDPWSSWHAGYLFKWRARRDGFPGLGGIQGNINVTLEDLRPLTRIDEP